MSTFSCDIININVVTSITNSHGNVTTFSMINITTFNDMIVNVVI